MTMRTIQREIEREDGTWRIRARYGIDATSPSDSYFALSGEAYLRRGNHRYAQEPDACGQITGMILEAFPELGLMARMHLCDAVTGEPLYAVANGWYWLCSTLRGDLRVPDGWESLDGPQRAAAYLGCDKGAFAQITPRDPDDLLMRAEFERRVNALRPEWERLAALARRTYSLELARQEEKDAA